MKRGTRHLVSIGLDVLCLAAGNAMTFLAALADYEGTASQFWCIRLVLGTAPVFLAGLVSSLLPGEGTPHKWVRFALFELLTLVFMVQFFMPHRGAGLTGFDTAVLPLLVDAAAYGVGLHVRHLFTRTPGPNGLSR